LYHKQIYSQGATAMKKAIVSLGVVAAFAYADTATMQIAKQSMQKLGTSLKSELVAKFKEDPSGIKAVNYCSKEAQEMTRQINARLQEGVSVRRTALQYRNDANEPSIQDIEVMRIFQKRMQKGQKADTLSKTVQTAQKTYVYKALGTGKPCLTCHGDAQTMKKDIVDAIDANFPHDRAKNFALGDFRGALVVEIEKR
jgi:hypothetical protein